MSIAPSHSEQLSDTEATMTWAERAAERSPKVRRSRARGVEQARSIVEAAQRLIAVKGSAFTTQDLVREAGIALKTFYRYFGGKDQLILAVIENMVDESSERFREAAERMEDPVERIQFYISSVIGQLAGQEIPSEGARFLAAEHWRLLSVYPVEIAQASHSYTELLQEEIEAATAAGLLHPADPAYASWLLTQLVRAVFHSYSFVPPKESPEEIAQKLWAFCATGLGGAHES